MSDISADVCAKWRVVPENVVTLSIYLNTTKNPPPIAELKEFEDDILKMV